MNSLRLFLLNFLLKKEVENMAVVYATLIVKGKKTFSQVPVKLRNEVRDILVTLDCGELAE